jgi:tetratricopeptide (TPR) repeat protein
MMSHFVFYRAVWAPCCLFIALLLGSSDISAQSKKDSLYLHSIQNKARELEGKNLDSSFYWARFQLKEAKRLEYKRFIATAYNQLGINYSKKGMVDSAFFFYNQAKSFVSASQNYVVYNIILFNEAILYREINDIESSKQLIRMAIRNDIKNLNYRDFHYSLVELGNCLIAQDSLSKAISIYEKALEAAKYCKDTLYMGGICINMASEYLNMNLYDDAKVFIDKANKYFSSINNVRGKCFANALLGEYYSYKKDYIKSLTLRTQTMTLVSKLNDILLLGDYHEGIGACYYNLSKYDSSLFYHRRALEFRDKKAVSDQVASSHYNIAQSYFKLGEIKKAKSHIDQALTISDEGNQQMFYYSHRLAAQIDSSLGNNSSAYKHMREALKYHEAYFNDEAKTALFRSKTKLEKEAQLLKMRNGYLEQESHYIRNIDRQRTLRNYWIASFTAVLLLVVVFFAYRSRKQREAQFKLKLKLYAAELESLNAQIDTHFIYNTLSTIQQFIYSQRVEAAMRALHQFAQLLRNSLSSTRSGSVSLRDELKSIALFVELECNRLEHPPKFMVHVDEKIAADSIRIPPMFIQPLIENAIKHGVSRLALDGNIQLHVLGNDASSIRIQVWDNGPQGYAKTNPVNGLSMSNSILQERLQLYNSKLKTSKFVLQLKTIEASNSTNTVAELILPVLH